jgi:hypothetical protein
MGKDSGKPSKFPLVLTQTVFKPETSRIQLYDTRKTLRAMAAKPLGNNLPGKP